MRNTMQEIRLGEDYPKFQAEAKLMADELGSNQIWSEITFRAATEDDKEKIKSAVHSEESIHGNGDWAVKLEMNLYYSANLSRSPLYSQQMPYNSVIYSAFGCSSSDNDPAGPKVYGKGSGKQKKIIVAGKWCGKVWMSNQVHALLAGRDDEREKERSFLALPAPEHPKPSVKLEKPSKTNKVDVASVSSRVERKRKSNSEIRSASRAKSIKIEEPARVLDDASDEKVIRQYKRNFRNKRKKEMKETPHPMDSCEQETKQSTSHIEDVLEGGPSTRLRKRSSQPPTENRAKVVEVKSVKKKETKYTEGASQPPKEKRAKVVEAKSVTKKRTSKTEGTSRPPTEKKAKLVEAKPVTKKHTSNAEGTSKPPTENRAKLVETKSVAKMHTSNAGTSKPPTENKAKVVEAKSVTKKQTSNTEGKKVPKIKTSAANSNKNRGNSNKSVGSSNKSTSSTNKNTSDEEAEYACEIDGCTMSFSSKQELMQHKRNICPVKGCGKKFFSHKYLVQHRRVHIDDRPLKCPWKGCKMTFKWAWARTEHIRVHTGVRPYICSEDGCGQTFRFVSDFSRHKRKTGHSTKKANK